MEITQSRVRELFDYSEDGNLFWKLPKQGRQLHRPVGCKSETRDGKIYLLAMIDGKLYKVHRLIFMWHHGFFPENIDHIDGNSLNNRIENLRAVSPKDNSRNKSISKNNTSGYKGVSWDKRKEKWAASIMVNRKHIFLGYHDDPAVAHEAYKKAAANYHGDFARCA